MPNSVAIVTGASQGIGKGHRASTGAGFFITRSGSTKRGEPATDSPKGEVLRS